MQKLFSIMFSDIYQSGPSTDTYQGIAAANITRTGEIHRKFNPPFRNIRRERKKFFWGMSMTYQDVEVKIEH